MWMAYGQTSIGKVRSDNQDHWVGEILSQHGGGLLLCGVADGMGGHLAGGVASRTAVSELSAALSRNNPQRDHQGDLQRAFMAANERVFLESLQNPACSGMGTTLTAAVVHTDRLYLCHVGDSRAYKFSGSKLLRLTEDHSVVEELVRRGELSWMDAETHPQRHVLTRALGIGTDLEPDCQQTSLHRDEALLLCTDGLTRMVSDSELSNILSSEVDPGVVVNKLVELALMRGAPDNVTVVLVVWEGGVN
jgi:protein phosphatase